MVYPSDRNPDRSPDVAGFLHRDASGDRELLPDPGAAAHQPHPRMETMQSSLVERIAAVDDERRRTATQMHRAIETQRGEVTRLAKGQRWAISLVAVLMILLVGFSIGLTQLWMGQTQRELSATLERLQQRMTLLETGSPTEGGQGATVVDEAAADDAPAGNEPAGNEPVASASSFTADAVHGATSNASTQGLEDQIAALRERLASLMVEVTEIKSIDRGGASTNPANRVAAAGTGLPVTAANSPSVPARTPKTPPLASDQSERPQPEGLQSEGSQSEGSQSEGSQSEGPQSEDSQSKGLEPVAEPEPTAPGDATVAATANPSTSGTAPAAAEMDSRSVDELVDALIDRRLDAVDRDYQRLARELSAPAVRPRHAAEDEPPAATEATTIDIVAASPAGLGVTAATPSDELARISITDRPIALQLIGFYRRELLDEFVARSPLPREVYAREETFRGRPWFVLIHSLHGDRAAARQVSEALPDELGALDLWIRELPSETELEVIETAVDPD